MNSGHLQPVQRFARQVIQTVQSATALAPNSIFRTMESSILTIQSNRSRLTRFIGLLFFIPGCLIMLIPAMPPLKWEGGEAPPILFTTLFGLLFATIGLVVMVGENGTTIDKKTRIIRRWFRLFITVNRSSKPIPQLPSVQLITRVVSGGKGKTTILFVAQIDSQDLAKFTDSSEARRTAESLAKFFQCDLSDSTTGTTVVREWKYLNEAVGDRIRRTREALPEVKTHTNSKLTVSDLQGSKSILLSPDRNALTIAAVLSLLMLIFPSVFIFMTLENRQGTFQLVDVFFAVIPAIMFLSVIMRVAWMFARKVTIKLSTAGLEIEEKVAFYNRKTEMAFNKLEQIVLSQVAPSPMLSMLSNGAITLVNDTDDITIGKGLNEGDTAYLYALLMQAAAGKRI